MPITISNVQSCPATGVRTVAWYPPVCSYNYDVSFDVCCLTCPFSKPDAPTFPLILCVTQGFWNEFIFHFIYQWQILWLATENTDALNNGAQNVVKIRWWMPHVVNPKQNKAKPLKHGSKLMPFLECSYFSIYVVSFWEHLLSYNCALIDMNISL